MKPEAIVVARVTLAMLLLAAYATLPGPLLASVGKARVRVIAEFPDLPQLKTSCDLVVAAPGSGRPVFVSTPWPVCPHSPEIDVWFIDVEDVVDVEVNCAEVYVWAFMRNVVALAFASVFLSEMAFAVCFVAMAAVGAVAGLAYDVEEEDEQDALSVWGGCTV